VTLIYISIAWVLGTYLGSKVYLPPVLFPIGVVPFCLLPLLAKYKKHLLLTGFCLLALLGGNLRFQTNLHQTDEHHLQFYNDKGMIEISGMVHTEPERSGNSHVFQFTATELDANDETVRITGKALIFSSRYSEYHYGDILRITGEPKTPPELDNFDYKSYLTRKDIHSVIYYPRIEVLATDRGFKLLSWLYSLRNYLSHNLSQVLPEPQASLAQAILLGLRADMPQPLRDSFNHTGTTHLLAISGLHLSIVVGITISMGVWLFGRRHYIYIWLALLTIWLYAIVTAMRPPIVRGAIMGSLFLIAEYLGRPHSATTALAFAAAVMTGVNPHILWDASFQLSFLAMIGLVVLAPRFQTAARERLATRANQDRAVSSLINFVIDSLAVTLAAILATCPVIAYHFGIIPLVSLPATFFALPALPGIILTSSLVSIVGPIIPALSQLLGWIAWLFLSYFIFIVQAYNALPFSYSELSQVHLWQVLVYYLLLGVCLSAIRYRMQVADITRKLFVRLKDHASHTSKLPLKATAKWLAICLLIGNAIVWTAASSIPDNKLHVSILDVGQGDAILIQTPSRQSILIDGGPTPEAIKLQLGKRMPFWERTINLVVLTQPQSDHLAGLIEVIQRYETLRVMESDTSSDTAAYQEWLRVLRAKNIKREIIHAGQEIDLGDNIKLEVIHPPLSWLQNTASNINDNGVVLRLSWNRVSFLFTADISKEVEWYLISQRKNLCSTVLKVAHHGSKTATSPEFLSVVNPKIAVISVGSDNKFGQPHHEVLERLTSQLGNDRVFLTSQHGTINLTSDGYRLWIEYSK